MIENGSAGDSIAETIAECIADTPAFWEGGGTAANAPPESGWIWMNGDDHAWMDDSDADWIL